MNNLTQFMARRTRTECWSYAPLQPETPLQMVAVPDIGRVAAALLHHPDAVPGGEIEIGGDELTAEQLAATFGAAAGKTARFAPVPIESIEDDDQHTMFAWFAMLPGLPGRLRLHPAPRPRGAGLADLLREQGNRG